MSLEQNQQEQPEEGLEIPFERVAPETLRRMIEEFVTREWADPADSGFTLEEKVVQVLHQLEKRTARIVYDVTSESWNIVAVK
jgi:uncharacterized protein YheU (UPF0270 family)